MRDTHISLDIVCLEEVEHRESELGNIPCFSKMVTAPIGIAISKTDQYGVLWHIATTEPKVFAALLIGEFHIEFSAFI